LLQLGKNDWWIEKVDRKDGMEERIRKKNRTAQTDSKVGKDRKIGKKDRRKGQDRIP